MDRPPVRKCLPGSKNQGDNKGLLQTCKLRKTVEVDGGHAWKPPGKTFLEKCSDLGHKKVFCWQIFKLVCIWNALFITNIHFRFALWEISYRLVYKSLYLLNDDIKCHSCCQNWILPSECIKITFLRSRTCWNANLLHKTKENRHGLGVS